METKTISAKYLVTNKIIDIEIGIDKKVKDLKKKIEELFEIKLANRLMIQKKGKRTQTSLNDEEMTIEEARIKDGDKITIAKTDVVGGKKINDK
jgi:phage antirepressor YoqD-like protein